MKGGKKGGRAGEMERGRDRRLREAQRKGDRNGGGRDSRMREAQRKGERDGGGREDGRE